MARIFIRIAVLASLLGLSACSSDAVSRVPLPDDAKLVTETFLSAVRRGDQAAAEKLLASTFVDDSRLQFAEMAFVLKNSPELVPAIYRPEAGVLGLNPDEIVVIYAAKQSKQWISSEIRLYRKKGGTFKIEYWDVRAAKQQPALLAHAQDMHRFTQWAFGAMALCAIAFLLILLWIVKRKTHILVPNVVADQRQVAATTSNSSR